MHAFIRMKYRLVDALTPKEMRVTLLVAVGGYPPGTCVMLDCRRSGIGPSMMIPRRLLLFGRTPDNKPIILVREELV